MLICFFPKQLLFLVFLASNIPDREPVIYLACRCFSRHYSVPRVPTIPGLESFPGLVVHSHEYRYPEVYQGMRVVIFGAGSSGEDICLQVAKCAEMVYLSHKKLSLVSFQTT